MENGKYTFWRKDTFSQKGGIFTSKKVYPNDPCPCGSGKKHKLCCKRKQDDADFVSPLNLLDNYKLIRKESRIKQCLHPNNEECSEKIIGAHSIQNNKILKRISSNGMVFMPCPKPDNPFAPMTSYGEKKRQYSLDFVVIMIKLYFNQLRIEILRKLKNKFSCIHIDVLL